jgi:hypothetical protein
VLLKICQLHLFFIMRNELMMFAFISVQYVCIVVCF